MTLAPELHDAVPADENWLLGLNNTHAVETSLLTGEQLRTLIASSFRTRIVRPDLALCIAFDQTAAYAGHNFLWFRERFGRFVYVDRLIVAAHARGRGLARALYGDLMEAARGRGHEMVCCEVNVRPPNPISVAFHAAMGFAEVGLEEMPDRSKTVSYLMRRL